MKKSSLIVVATALLALSGCSDHSMYGPQAETELDKKEYNTFDFSTVNKNVAVNIQYTMELSSSVYFEIYDQEPGTWVNSAYVLKEGVQPLYAGWTDEEGKFSKTLNLPAYTSTLHIYSPAFQARRIMTAEVVGNSVNINSNYDEESTENAATRGPKPAGFTYMTTAVDSRQPAAYADGNWQTWLISSYGENGRINSQDKIDQGEKVKVSEKKAKELIALHNQVINVHIPCPGEYKSYADLKVTKATEIGLTFLGGNTCWNSTLGYYYYEEGKEPASLSEANVILVFPNTQNGTPDWKGSNKMKGIDVGDGVKLKYYPNIANGSTEGETYTFPAGIRVGLVLATNAWSKRVKDGDKAYRAATSPNLSVNDNGEAFNAPRTAVYRAGGYTMVSFEDYIDDTNFSDVVVTLSTSVEDAIPGDEPDPEPFDVELLKGIYAFEDLWPAAGDFDMNDVMTKATYTKKIDIHNKIYEESYTFKTYGNYATLTNGLAVRLDGVSSTDKLEFYVKAAGAEEFSTLETTYDATDRVVVLTNDVTSNKGAEYKVKVIHAESSPVEKETIDAEPFIFRAEDGGDAVAWWEVHLTGKTPTSKMNKNYFGKGDDCSQPDKNIFYVRSGNYPFAFFLAGATEADLSKMLDPENESVAIDKLYSGYKEWVTSNGTQSAAWYKAE